MNGKIPVQRRGQKKPQSVVLTPMTVNSKESLLVISGNSRSPDSMKEQPMRPFDESYTRPVSRSRKYGCLIPSLREQKLPKSVWQKNTRRGQKTNPSGQSTVLSAIGNLAGKKPTMANHTNSLFLRTFWQFCFLFSFAASLNPVDSHNLNGTNVPNVINGTNVTSVTNSNVVTIGSHNLHNFK